MKRLVFLLLFCVLNALIGCHNKVPLHDNKPFLHEPDDLGRPDISTSKPNINSEEESKKEPKVNPEIEEKRGCDFKTFRCQNGACKSLDTIGFLRRRFRLRSRTQKKLLRHSKETIYLIATLRLKQISFKQTCSNTQNL